ncbi:MAG: hypothetical protein H6816_02250 [Phycisphaerales bacterium]|nr:hypothetical protein [Phycisphaerales bacterium]
MAKKQRSSVQKRDREQQKRQRERRKAEKAALKRERRAAGLPATPAPADETPDAEPTPGPENAQ